jgi:hypothetical protein
MGSLFLATIISCTQFKEIGHKLFSQFNGLSLQQKYEIINELKKVVPSCPITIKDSNNESKRNSGS